MGAGGVGITTQAGGGGTAISSNNGVPKQGSGQQLKCPHCNKILTTSVGLMYHIRLHTGRTPTVGAGGSEK